MQFDYDKMAAAMLMPVKAYVDKAYAAVSDGLTKLSERIARLEAVAEKGYPDPLPGRDADPALMQRMVDVAVKALPTPKDGVDGLGFDDLAVTHDGERAITLRFSQGDKAKEFSFTIPSMIFRGVYKSEQSYEAGDAVTFGGSCWVALKSTADKPGASSDWQLAVKRGRDGRAAEDVANKDHAPVRVSFKSGGANG